LTPVEMMQNDDDIVSNINTNTMDDMMVSKDE
jgi:hypothetical protein